MQFTDNFEYEWAGQTFYVEVEGYVADEGPEDKTITKLSVRDEQDEDVESTHEAYADIQEEAISRDYEIHGASFEHSDVWVDSFLREDV